MAEKEDPIQEAKKISVREKVISQVKFFRNYSIKTGIVFFVITFSGNFCYTVFLTQSSTLKLQDHLITSSMFSIVFGVLGYCIGAIIGEKMHKQHVHKLKEIRRKRKEALDQQIAARKSQLEILSKPSPLGNKEETN